MKHSKIVYFLSFVLMFAAVSCSDGEDGADGINGIDGINGTNGTNGANGVDGVNGQDGQDGQGFNELTKFGYITMNLEGTRLDGVEFTDSITFPYTAVKPDIFGFPINALQISDEGEDTGYIFSILRFLSNPENAFQNSTIGFGLGMVNLGEENEQIVDAFFSIDDYAVIGEDNKYFSMEGDYELGDNAALIDSEISDLSFDFETNRLVFSYRFEVLDTDNPTGNNLIITGMADVIVPERLIEP